MTTALFEDVIYDVRGRAAWIIINRAKVYNAFRGRTVEELIQAFQRAANDNAVASIVLTGAGDKAFCTGGDQSAPARCGFSITSTPAGKRWRWGSSKRWSRPPIWMDRQRLDR